MLDGERGLGDRVELALSAVRITPEQVERWLGKPCGCEERKQKLNQLGYWAKQVLARKLVGAEHYLERMINDG